MVQISDVDFGRIAQAYAKDRPSYPEELFRRLFALGVAVPGQRALDLGTGTGALARELARASCLVTGLDRSPELLDEALRIDQEVGAEIEYVRARAEETGLPDKSFDLVTAAQCWHWFKRSRAAREARRLLVPGGKLALISFDWLPVQGGVVEATEELVLQHNPAWVLSGGTGLHPEWILDVTDAGFSDPATISFDETVLFTHRQWRGRVRASAGVAASLDPGAVRQFDEELKDLLATYFAREPLEITHRAFALVCEKK